MSVLQMQRISICAMKKRYRKRNTERSSGFSGTIESRDVKWPEGNGLTKMDTLEDRQKF